MVNTIEMNQLDHLFNPRSICFVGATTDPMKIGSAIVKNLSKLLDSSLKIYFVAKKLKELHGSPVYSSILEIKAEIDLVLIMVPSKYVEQVIDECISIRVKGIIIMSAGFGELTKEGKIIEQRIVNKCNNVGIRVVGPNCVGLQNTQIDLNASFIQHPPKGNVGMVSQSGSLAAACIWKWRAQGIGCSKMINLGNASDIKIPEIVQYFQTDDETDVITVYMESIKNGREFVRILQKTTKTKPVLVLKGGRNPTGLTAAQSHTGSISTNYDILKAALTQAGGISCISLGEFNTGVKTFAHLPVPKGEKIGVITASGGGGVLYCDFLEDFNLKLSTFSETLKSQISEVVIPLVRLINPLDIIASADETNFYETTKILLQSSEIDIVVICSLVPPHQPGEPQSHMRGVLNAWDETGRQKPVIPIMINAENFSEISNLSHEGKMPIYYSPKAAAYATSLLIKRKNYLKKVM